MIEVLRTNDAIRLNYAVILLKEAGCYPFVADRFMSAAEGGIAAFERRVMVPDEFAGRAKEALKLLDEPATAVADPQDGDWQDGEP